MRSNEIYIKPVKAGEQNLVVEEGLSILGQPLETLIWVTDDEAQPVFISGKILGKPNMSGEWMLLVWTRVKKEKENATIQ